MKTLLARPTRVVAAPPGLPVAARLPRRRNCWVLAAHITTTATEKENAMSPTANNATLRETRRRRSRSGLRLVNVTVAGLAGMCLLLGECVGTSSASTTSPGSAQLKAELAYARCMRAHGVTDYPDPNSQGAFPPFQTHVSKQTSDAAQHACQHLLPHGGGAGGAGTRGDQQKLAFGLKTARCMRRHGYPTYPDPAPGGASSQGSGTRFDGTGIDTKSLRFQMAETACERQARQELGLPPAK